MIKLSKVQIEALASKIISDIKRPVIEYNKSIENSDEYKLFFERNEDCIQLTQICKKYDLDDYELKRLKNNIRFLTFKNAFKSVPSLSQGAVEQEIILMTIESEDLSKLVEQVSLKFSI